MLKPPAWAKAVIVADHDVDHSDIMTDYFSVYPDRTVALAYSRHAKDAFAEMRKAAATFPETAHLAADEPKNEHREKYSMGHGYYLKAGSTYSTGWTVRKRGLPLYYGADTIEDHTAAAPADAAEPTGPVTVPTVSLNAAKNGVELRFPAKPSEDVRNRLKDAGWRWSRFSSCWYHRDTPDARAFADRMVAPAAE